jgi:hypothetical protein
MNPVDWKLQKKDLLDSDSSLRRHVSLGSTCGQRGKGLFCVDDYTLQFRYGGVIKWRCIQLKKTNTAVQSQETGV